MILTFLMQYYFLYYSLQILKILLFVFFLWKFVLLNIAAPELI